MAVLFFIALAPPKRVGKHYTSLVLPDLSLCKKNHILNSSVCHANISFLTHLLLLVAVVHLFSLLHSVPFYGCAKFIHTIVDGLGVLCQFLAAVNSSVCIFRVHASSYE